MQKEVRSSSLLETGRGGGSRRLELIYHAHERLEMSVARLKGLIELYDHQAKSGYTFEVWDDLRNAVNGAGSDLVSCLRLFSGHRRLPGFHGLPTVSTLYAANQATSERVINFIHTLRPSFANMIPLSIIIVAARVVQRANSRAAYEFLHTYTSETLDQLMNVPNSSQHNLLDVMYSTDSTRRRDFITLLTLEVECEAAVDKPSNTWREEPFNGGRDRLVHYLGAEMVDRLVQYSHECREVLPAQHIQLRKQRISRQTSLPTENGGTDVIKRDAPAKLANSSEKHALSKTTNHKEDLSSVSRDRSYTLYERVLNPLNLNGWPLYTSRAVIVAIFLLLLKLAFTKLINVAQSVRGATRSVTRGKSRMLSI